MEKPQFTKSKALDKKAFKLIFDKFFNALCAFAYKYLNEVSAAEDLVQEAFVSFWEKGENFENESAIKAFLYTSVRNKCLNYLKHQTVKQKHEQNLIYELESDQFFTQHVIEEEVFNQLYQEISQLPKSAQQIMLLALKGLKNKEIAEQLDISENTVKTQKKIAYSKLKQKLSPPLNAILLTL
ncbi:MAG: RNA polymerase sigma-70 factor [Thalassobius sp.]|nr:RNA polymerase sigma-70 factor [Thalassovita sp.]